jgi:hypothetical protein
MGTRVARRIENPYLDDFLRVMEYAPDEEWWSDRWRPRAVPSLLEGATSRLRSTTRAFEARDTLVKRYAWAVPNTEALETIAALDKPVVEVGAGLGYWASRLEKMGVQIVAFDKEPGGTNTYTAGAPWTHVLYGDARQLRHTTSDHVLLLCWPPYDEPMAAECVEVFKGDTVVYVGEGNGGCCASSAFWEQMEGDVPGTYDEDGNWIEGADIVVDWEETAAIDIPRWYGMRDRLIVYRR